MAGGTRLKPALAGLKSRATSLLRAEYLRLELHLNVDTRCIFPVYCSAHFTPRSWNIFMNGGYNFQSIVSGRLLSSNRAVKHSHPRAMDYVEPLWRELSCTFQDARLPESLQQHIDLVRG